MFTERWPEPRVRSVCGGERETDTHSDTRPCLCPAVQRDRVRESIEREDRERTEKVRGGGEKG